MDDTKTLSLLRGMYTGAMADACLRFQNAGILDEVTAAKREDQRHQGPRTAALLGITTVPETFLVLRDLFACADWVVETEGGTHRATASACQLAALARRMGAGCPCRIYCLNPLEGLVLGLAPEARFLVEETLWEGRACRVRVEVTEAD